MTAPPSPPAVVQIDILSAGWYRMERYTVELAGARRALEVCHRGDSVAVLLVHRGRGTILLTRQFRLPVLVNGRPDGKLLEVPGGRIDEHEDAEVAARREVEEETGIRPRRLRRLLLAQMTPSLVTERVHLFVAEFDDTNRVGAGGGLATEGEEIEMIEYPVPEVFAMATRGEIVDGRTLLLLYCAYANGMLPA